VATEMVAQWCGLAEVEPVLRNFLGSRCRDSSELDDVVQETLLRAARYRSGLLDPERLRAWTLRIALNVLCDHVRRESRMHRVEPSDDLLDRLEGREPDPGSGGEVLVLPRVREAVDKQEALGHLKVALGRMRTDDQRVLEIYYQGASCAQAGLHCDIPQELVKVRLFRARRRLLRVLRPALPAPQSRAALPCPSAAGVRA
jgi:RNA polymerase sigma-70 factor, ECF subfamily